MINAILTKKCNYACKHCLWSCGRKGEEITHQTKHYLNNLIKKYSPDLNILGGEISTMKDYSWTIKEMLISGNTDNIRIVSNGSWIYSKAKRETFKKMLLNSLDILRNGSVSLCISNDNFHAEFWRDNKHIKLIKDFLFDIQGNDDDQENYYSDDFLEDLSNFTNFYFEDENRQYNNIIGMGRALKYSLLDYGMDNKSVCCHNFCSNEDKEFLKENPSQVWHENLTIFPNGDLSPCCQGVAIIGNINNDNFDILEQRLAHFFLNTKDNLCFGDCKNCKKIYSKVLRECQEININYFSKVA
jgi:hypothetical protein